ncbi:hypothetical protein KO481_33025 [Nocardia sp. NEAU-G5]|uniref:Uncharacterized protein n=1 Tax=Nocardia albiluteola TaxID=2842303 RepID=A0ABS6B993_9NOCA|nr:hypothetical protein [Nocardia albiluteola]MBU3066330.1 hypothetical protein [Nocardia albiluteola]
MAPTVLTVDPDVYYRAARQLIALSTDIHTAVGRDLVSQLAATAGMSGNYPAVATWNGAYRQHADDVRDASVDYAAALQHFADILNIAGYNWQDAEYNANVSADKGSPPQRPTPTAPNSLNFPDIPDPNGDNGPGLVITSHNSSPSPWTGAPNGRADALQAASTTWNTFANSAELSNAPHTLTAVRDSFNGIQATEIPDIQEALEALRSGAIQIADVAESLGTQLRNHRDDLIDARTQLCASAAAAFPGHPGVQVAATSDNSSVHVSVAADLDAVDIDNAESIFTADEECTGLFSALNAAGDVRHALVDPSALSVLPKLKALTQLPLLVADGSPIRNAKLVGELDNITTWETPAPTLTAENLSALDKYGPQMKKWAMLSVKYGNEAGVDPRMVLAMALQEGAPLRTGYDRGEGKNLYTALQNPSTYHPDPDGAGKGALWDEARLRASEVGISKNGAGNSIGLTNMKERQFNEVKNKYPDQFQGKQWSDLVGNDDLALKASAYNLKMLTTDAANQALPRVQAGQPLDQFLGSGYNAWGIVENSKHVADGGSFKPNEIEHGRSTVSVAALADQILCGSGAYR